MTEVTTNKTDLSNLNDRQNEAVVSDDKRILVLAGAGSGKTKTLLQKMDRDNSKRGFASMAKNYKEKADAIQVHVDKMKEILFDSQKLV